MMWIDYEAKADQWEAEQAEMAWWAEQEAQYAQDYNDFVEAMEALDEDEESKDWDEPYDLEMGFNPYMGCYDGDC